KGSRASGCAMTVNKSAASSTLRAIGPTWGGTPTKPAGCAGTRPKVGLKPPTPVYALGPRLDPPPSVASGSGPRPAAMAATAPALLPPVVYPGCQGFLVTPVSGLAL